MGDAGHHALHQTHVALVLQGTEAQGIEQGDRAGAHGEDVAQDAADTRCRPLERLHRRGVVVALDLEGQPLALTQIHHAGVLAGAHQDAGAGGREALQQRPRIAIAAVLRPHHPEHAELGTVGGAAEAATDLVVVGLAEVLLLEGIGNRIGRCFERGGNHVQLGKITPVSPSGPHSNWNWSTRGSNPGIFIISRRSRTAAAREGIGFVGLI